MAQDRLAFQQCLDLISNIKTVYVDEDRFAFIYQTPKKVL
jgi:hypothetical protein